MKRIKAECEEAEQADGSLMIKVRRQNNCHPVGGYLN